VTPDHQLGSLLGRWHQWRRAYSHERGYARASLDAAPSFEDSDELESMQMRAIDTAVESMPFDMQIALQHIARAECMGVEVLFIGRMPADKAARESLIERAQRELYAKLLRMGVV
jgi:hypothetical protein